MSNGEGRKQVRTASNIESIHLFRILGYNRPVALTQTSLRSKLVTDKPATNLRTANQIDRAYNEYSAPKHGYP